MVSDDERRAAIACQQRQFLALWRQQDAPTLAATRAKVLTREVRFLARGAVEASVRVDLTTNHKFIEQGALWGIVVAGVCNISRLDGLVAAAEADLGPARRAAGPIPPYPLYVWSLHDPEYMPPLRRDGTLTVPGDADIEGLFRSTREAIDRHIMTLVRCAHAGGLELVDAVLRRQGHGYRSPALIVAAACAAHRRASTFDEVSGTKRFAKILHRDAPGIPRNKLREWVHRRADADTDATTR